MEIYYCTYSQTESVKLSELEHCQNDRAPYGGCDHCVFCSCRREEDYDD